MCLCRGFFDEEEDGKPFKPGGRLGDIEDDNVEEEDEEIHVKASFALGRQIGFESISFKSKRLPLDDNSSQHAFTSV